MAEKGFKENVRDEEKNEREERENVKVCDVHDKIAKKLVSQSEKLDKVMHASIRLCLIT